MRQLVAMEAFKHAVQSVRAHLNIAFWMSLPWLIVVMVITLGRYIYLRAHLTGNQQQDDTLAISTGIPLFLIVTFAFCSIAVNWHRFVFLDEIVRGFDRLRTDRLVWRYFGNFLLIVLILSLAIMMASLPLAVVLAVLQVPVEKLQDVAAWPWPIRIGVQFVIACLVTALFFRFAVKLPAIALGRTDFGLGHAWSATRQNMASLAALAVLNMLTILAAEAVLEVLGIVLGRAGDATGTIAIIVLGTFLQWLVAILGTTILTSLYGYFVENRDF
jgi:hypothetical protein